MVSLRHVPGETIMLWMSRVIEGVAVVFWQCTMVIFGLVFFVFLFEGGRLMEAVISIAGLWGGAWWLALKRSRELEAKRPKPEDFGLGANQQERTRIG
jgi:hypothetical protein